MRTLMERKPSPMGVVQGPFSATRCSRTRASVASGSGSPKRSAAAAPAYAITQSMATPVAATTSRAAAATSGPMPSPGMSTTFMDDHYILLPHGGAGHDLDRRDARGRRGGAAQGRVRAHRPRAGPRDPLLPGLQREPRASRRAPGFLRAARPHRRALPEAEGADRGGRLPGERLPPLPRA